MRRKKQQQTPTWTPRDDALLYTCQLAAIMTNPNADYAEIPEMPAPFPPASGERLWAAGWFVLSDWTAVGDGGWQVSTPVVGGTGAVGAGALVGSLIGGAVTKKRAAAQAWADAQPRWVPVEEGTLFCSGDGFYMHTPRVLRWHWAAITGANMVGPGTLHFSGESQNGSVSWLLTSDWAELVFVTWALHQHPHHPQLLTGWLPPGWAEHARAYHQPLPPENTLPGAAPGMS